MNWFAECTSVGAIKSLYRSLAKKYHPDVAGAEFTATMQDINAQYHDALSGRHGEKTVDEEKQEHTYYYKKEVEQELMDKIAELLGLRMEGVEIELVGTWIWVSGNTKVYKDKLGKDGLKLMWHSKRLMWYWRRFTHRTKYSDKDMDQLRWQYGSTKFDVSDSKAVATA